MTAPASTPFISPALRADRPCILVLASGRGERFTASGGHGHKLQALLGGETVLARTLATVHSTGLPWHVEDAGHPGMGDSIAAAVRATASAGGWLVLPADLPLVRFDTLLTLAAQLDGPDENDLPDGDEGDDEAIDNEEFDEDDIEDGSEEDELPPACAVAVPVHKGQRGHPVAFSAQCRESLLALTGEQGAASVVAHYQALKQVRRVPVDDMGTVTDIDTLEDLARAEKLLGSSR